MLVCSGLHKFQIKSLPYSWGSIELTGLKGPILNIKISLLVIGSIAQRNELSPMGLETTHFLTENLHYKLFNYFTFYLVQQTKHIILSCLLSFNHPFVYLSSGLSIHSVCHFPFTDISVLFSVHSRVKHLYM